MRPKRVRQCEGDPRADAISAGWLRGNLYAIRTTAEVATILGMRAYRVNQIERAALRKLATSPVLQQLWMEGRTDA